MRDNNNDNIISIYNIISFATFAFFIYCAYIRTQISIIIIHNSYVIVLRVYNIHLSGGCGDVKFPFSYEAIVRKVSTKTPEECGSRNFIRY